MKTDIEYSGSINFKAIFASAIIAIGVQHAFMTGIRSFGVMSATEPVFYTQRLPFMFGRTIVMAFAFFLAAFIATIASKNKSLWGERLHALTSMSLVHMVVFFIIPYIFNTEALVPVANLSDPLLALRNFFTEVVAWLTGFYGIWLAQKMEKGEIEFRGRNERLA